MATRMRQTRRPTIERSSGSPGAGLPIDRYGAGAIDPTENVLALVDALSETQKLLRAADTLRQDDLRTAETKREDDIRAQRDAYEERISKMTAEFQSQMAVVLSTQTEKSANLLAMTVDKLSTATNERLAAVEKNQWESGGKTSVSDPATAIALRELAAAMRPLTATKDSVGGMAQMAGWLAAGFMGLVSVGLFVVNILALKGR